MRFKRLEKLRKKDAAIAAAAKKKRIQTIRGCMQIFGLINGNVPQTTNNYLIAIGKLLDSTGREDELKKLVNEWLRFEPKNARLLAKEKPKHFFYYLRERQLSERDMVVYYAYEMLSEDYIPEPPEARRFKGLGEAIMDRLVEWLGDDGGNDPEEVLIDYLKAVFVVAARFNRQVIANPDTILGDFGWRAWLEWVNTEYGSRNGYLLPTEAEITESAKRRKLYHEFASVRARILIEGDLALYDQLGQRSVNGDDEIRAIIEEYRDDANGEDFN